ncbi:hypothetical protein C0V73_00020 [Rhizobium sp. TH135]|nr:hypothetical protein C0V73_00020 [Rhizobium sp. TH135]
MVILYSVASILFLCVTISVVSLEWFRHLAKQLQLYMLLTALVSGMWWFASSQLSAFAMKPGANELMNNLNRWAAGAAVLSAALGIGIYVGNASSKTIEKRRREKKRIQDAAIEAAIQKHASNSDTP